MPKSVYPGSLASPSILAHVMNQKVVESQPLYRQEQQFARMGLTLSRQTLANWMMYGSDQWLTPLFERMKEYRPTRGGEHPRNFLAGFSGYLHVDGYAGYHKVAKVTLVGCWAHTRRKLDEALKALPASEARIGTAAQQGLTFCNQLFAIERELKEVTPEERETVRMERSRPILDAFSAWLRQQKSRVLPKSALGQAITYCLNQWEKLTAFLKEDGRLEIDNNRSERAIKPFVIGRKNWLFDAYFESQSTSYRVHNLLRLWTRYDVIFHLTKLKSY